MQSEGTKKNQPNYLNEYNKYEIKAYQNGSTEPLVGEGWRRLTFCSEVIYSLRWRRREGRIALELDVIYPPNNAPKSHWLDLVYLVQPYPSEKKIHYVPSETHKG